MKFVKYCRAEHNISVASTVRVGTLDYYRMHDNKFIADPNEGQGAHLVAADEKIEISEIELQKIFDGSNIKIQGAGITLMPGSSFRFASGVPNTLIFCISKVEEPTLAMAASLGYDSFYEIVDIENFTRLLGSGLLHHCLLQSDFPGRIGITPVRTSIRYQESRDHQHRQKPDPDLLPYMALFTKPRISKKHPDVSFENNLEYRIAWSVHDETHWLSVGEAPMDVPVTDELRATCRW